MRSAFAVLAPAAEFLAKLLWVIAKFTISMVLLCGLFILGTILLVGVMRGLGVSPFVSDVVYAVFLIVSFLLMFVLIRWVIGWHWISQIGATPNYQRWDYSREAEAPKRCRGIGGIFARRSLPAVIWVPPTERTLGETLWVFSKGIGALAVWVVCVSLVGYWMLWLCEANALDGIAADAVDGGAFAVWVFVAFWLAMRLDLWVDGERWRDWSGGPPAYRRSDYAPESEKSCRG